MLLTFGLLSNPLIHPGQNKDVQVLGDVKFTPSESCCCCLQEIIKKFLNSKKVEHQLGVECCEELITGNNDLCDAAENQDKMGHTRKLRTMNKMSFS